MADLQIDHVTKAFGDTQVLKGISLDIADGEFVSLIGPSGCGKSTLLRIIAGLEGQTSGAIRISGQDVSCIRAADRNLSMVFQSYALYPHLTVAENISVPLKMRKLSNVQRLPVIGPYLPGSRDRNVEIAAAVKHAAQTLEIDKLLDRKPGQLSGGQRQRVALGRALVREPAAFLLDEPLSNLDAKLRVQTRAEIAELHRRLGATFVYVTHDQVEAMTMSSRIAVMMGGEILQCDAPDEVYNNPLDIRVAEFIGSPKINILPVEARDGVLTFDKVVLPTLAPKNLSGPVRIGLRPEALRLAGDDSLLAGQVVHVENLGSEIFAQIGLEGHDGRVTLRAAPEQRNSLYIGANVGLAFDDGAALLFGPNGKRIFHQHVASTQSEVA
ncbi:ABC transporter ATP-binding protein [Shimia sp. R9_2]|uniref:ABC transporter ATP-binding protein n=1 Tax=Shimia sp. R9_2 TaxID=2821112 RepID=UPI001ADAF028|nr:ABC transporter ATP-binding protein [Shimia sp. R9_2]MBO9395833.1 ABC transporter ATP-binding protein [Shimia sp. R9_2]